MNDSNSSSTGRNAMYEPFEIVQTIYYSVLGLVGAFGNSLTLIALLTSTKLKNSCNIFIGNLCICDLITNTVVTGICIIRFGPDLWWQNLFICVFQYCLTAALAGVSLMTLICVALNRYLALAKPFSTYRSCCRMKGAAISIAFTWISSGILVVFPIVRGTRRPVYDPEIQACVADTSGSNWLRTTLVLFFYVILPSAIIVPCLYGMMFIAVRNSKKRVQPALQESSDERSMSAITDPATFTISSVSAAILESFPRQNKRERTKEEARLTKMPLLVFLVFAVCWLPHCVLHVVSKFTEVPAMARRIAFMCIWTNSSINPYLYAFTSQNFRLAYKRILKCQRSDTSRP
ncbi:G-protein coupled receptor moody-like [Amphiura filiformis]|uniref:G-protein coupled receptor moody-like n=1 Tax=Amphiura filiformis TaxID=82378 RepID=UPI003B20C14D